MVDILDTDFETTVLNMLKELQRICGESQENNVLTNENINKESENLKRNSGAKV